jgi:hypothetical protein
MTDEVDFKQLKQEVSLHGKHRQVWEIENG